MLKLLAKKILIHTGDKSSVKRAFLLLPLRDRTKIIYLTLGQILVSLLDLLGITILGLLAALSVQGIESREPGNNVNFLLKTLHMKGLTFHLQVEVLGIIIVVTLILKTVLSIILTRKTFFFLATKSAELSSELVGRLLFLKLGEIEKKKRQEVLYILSEGVKNIMLGIVATTSSVLADIFVFIFLCLGLLFIDLPSAILTLAILCLTVTVLHKLFRSKAEKIGIEYSRSTAASNEKIVQTLDLYKEIFVNDRRHYFLDSISSSFFELSELVVESRFMPYVSKYVIEVMTVIGGSLLVGFEFWTKNAVHAIATLTVFIAASSRLGPAALRIQQGVLLIKMSMGSANTTFDLVDELREVVVPVRSSPAEINFLHTGFEPNVKIEEISYKYFETEELALNQVSFQVKYGSSLAIVGPSGSGKTTLINLLLGLITPGTGTILISGMEPSNAINRWAGGIAYVPQNVYIFSGTVRENVSLSYGSKNLNDTEIWDALDAAQIRDLVENFPNGLDTNLGNYGSKLSGGERQRLGIARALFTKPKLLVMDEATSALDAQTELQLAEAIENLRGLTTLVVIAHRLSTIRTLDQILYLESGKVIAKGTFLEVREKVPNFERQAKLLGID